jgi:hypothetical protein
VVRARVLVVDPGVLLFGVRLRMSPVWMAVFIGKYGYVFIGAQSQKEPR